MKTAAPPPSVLPTLIVVTGRPGSGKTTLAHALARAIGCPVISRDEIKEGLVNTLEHGGTLEKEANWHVYSVFFETVEFLLSNSITLVAEAAFQHKLWAPKLESLQKIARIKVVICSVDPYVARSRVVQRSLLDPRRMRFHEDLVVDAAKEGGELPISTYEPPKLSFPTLTVDTSDGYHPAIGKIVSFVHDPVISHSRA